MYRVIVAGLALLAPTVLAAQSPGEMREAFKIFDPGQRAVCAQIITVTAGNPEPEESRLCWDSGDRFIHTVRSRDFVQGYDGETLTTIQGSRAIRAAQTAPPSGPEWLAFFRTYRELDENFTFTETGTWNQGWFGRVNLPERRMIGTFYVRDNDKMPVGMRWEMGGQKIMEMGVLAVEPMNNPDAVFQVPIPDGVTVEGSGG